MRWSMCIGCGMSGMDRERRRGEELLRMLDYEFSSLTDMNFARMRFNDGAVDPQGRYWAGTMNGQSLYPVLSFPFGGVFQQYSNPCC